MVTLVIGIGVFFVGYKIYNGAVKILKSSKTSAEADVRSVAWYLSERTGGAAMLIGGLLVLGSIANMVSK